RHHINWGVTRLVLHRGDPDLFTLTIAEVEELRQVIREAATIPGLPEVLGDRLATIPAGWGTRAFKTGMALYHAGMVDALPKRQATRSRPPLSTVPRIAAVMNRYVDERSLIDTKDSVGQARAALRRLSAWLAEHRPSIENLAELNRADLLDFLQWLQSQRKIKKPDQELS